MIGAQNNFFLSTRSSVLGNFPKLKNWAQIKCHPVIQFKIFSKISEKIELYDVRWKKYLPQKIIEVHIL